MAQTWKKQLESLLIKKYGKTKGARLARKYCNAFSHSYQDDNEPATAINDICYIESLPTDTNVGIKFYSCPDAKEYPLHLRLFQRQSPISLSVILPMLENLDLRTDRERPHKLCLSDDEYLWISDFSIVYNREETLNVKKVKDLFEDAFLSIYSGAAENDGFNKLVLGASLSWHEIIVLRAYSKYLHQIGFRFSQAYIQQALAAHPAIAKDLVSLFFALHDPRLQNTRKANPKHFEKRVLKDLSAVTSLDEDRILRTIMDVMKATLRTNYFQRKDDGSRKHYVSFKIESHNVPDLPLPMPKYEIFVYSPHLEGIHLRSSSVARGGIRWSDRPEDFRTEVLGLMKAQVVKNAIIVPSGAKGGFVLKTLNPNASREEVQAEVTKRYTNFIRGLLDLTDNIKNDKYIRPKDVVCHDDVDPYLVVAADKGTATFSDLANSIAAEYDFWLGDAFASGGSAGYDHKKMGITARGAWESIKRHFRELDINVMRQDISVVGIGDMSGDVFGNGMLYTKHIKLIAAFNHRDIFVDPTPDAVSSYNERLRLFKLPGSTWQDYDTSLISRGGGVFSRSLKSIKLTPQMRKALGTKETSVTPNQLICIILKAPVDLLFNGGIGTYVKATTQTNAEVGDRANDYSRVNGEELRCSVVGEGGNLGLTQLGRIEYALNGGLVNSDFIDNSGGVDCSDHEVNLKILLNKEVHAGKLSQTKRNKLLESLTKEISNLVLRDNHAQALVLSFTAFASRKYLHLHQAYIKELDTHETFSRQVEYIPDDKKLLERKAAAQGLTRPELAVILEYTKIYLKEAILKTDLPNDPFIGSIIESAFPPSIRKKYHKQMRNHRLYREIVATQLSSKIINSMGITFVYRLQTETGASIADIVRAYMIASHIFGTTELRDLIESLDFKIPMHTQYEMLYNIRNLINLASRWFLHSHILDGDLSKVINHYTDRVRKLEKVIPSLMAGFTRDYLNQLIDQFEKSGLSHEAAERIATYRAIYTALNIIDVSTAHNYDLIKTAEVYFAAGERVNLVWFRDQIAHDSREGHWNALARLTLRDELDVSQRALTIAIMKSAKKNIPTSTLIDTWMEQNRPALERWEQLLSLLHGSSSLDYSMFFITIRELLALINTSMGVPRR